jgi:hypothetical protein
MNQTELDKGIDGRDALDNEGGEALALLNALPRVEAPGNFEFGVRARIAARREKKQDGILTPLLKIAAPLALILVVTGLVFFYGTIPQGTSPSETGSSKVTESVVAGPPELLVKKDEPLTVSEPQLASPSQPERTITKQGTGDPIRIANNNRPRTGRGGSIDMPLGGSVDRALGSKNTIVPPGFGSANTRRTGNANIGSTTEVPVKEVLGILGVTAEFVDGICKVRAVTENSLGGRAGVKVGDAIEAIDGRQIKSDTKFNGASGGKTFTVRRDGKLVTVTIGN